MSFDAPKNGGRPPAAPAYLTTKEVAALLRVRERKVYDMAAAGEIPCRKVTGKLLFPKDELEKWLGAPEPQAETAPQEATPPSVIVGSHDPLLVWALGASGCEAPTLFAGSLDGLDRVARGEAMAAALHIYDPHDAGWNLSAIRSAGLDNRFVLIAFAQRRQGLVFREGAFEPQKLTDLREKRVALRQSGAGGRLLFEALLKDQGIGLDALEVIAEEARSETEIAEAIADGRAEAALGLEAMARRYNLGFTPLIDERFDLLIDRRAYFEPPLQRLLSFLASEAFRERATTMAGYDVSECGAVRWNGEP